MAGPSRCGTVRSGSQNSLLHHGVVSPNPRKFRHQVDLQQGLLHVTRRKHGVASLHPLRGPELRALRRLQRAYPDTALRIRERAQGAALRRCGAQRSSVEPDARPALSSRSIRTCCATPPATSWPTTGRTRGRSSIIWGTATFSIPPATANRPQTGSRISGVIGLR